MQYIMQNRIISRNAAYILMIGLAVFSVSCEYSRTNNTALTLSQSPIPSATITISPQIKPDLAFEQKDGLVTMTDRNSGFRITYPLEFKHTIKFGNGDNNTCFLNFDLSMEPFNGPYLESCSSQIYINLHEAGYDINPEGYNKPYETIQRDDGSNLYIIGREESQMRVCFDFAMDGIPCEGSIDVEPALYKRYGTAIMDMLKSLEVIQNATTIPYPTPSPANNLTFTVVDGHFSLTENRHGLEFRVPSEFQQVAEYAGYKDFCSVDFDFSKPPFNEAVSENCISRISVFFYPGMARKSSKDANYDFRIFQFAGSKPDLVLINYMKHGGYVNFEFESPRYPCGGFVSISEDLYEKYENEIVDMLRTIHINKTK